MQHNWEDKIRLSLEGMTPSDEAEARSRKEAIWESIALEPKKKSNKNLWLLLFLGPILFLSGWYMKTADNGATEPVPDVKTEKVMPMVAIPNTEMKRVQALLEVRERQIDSLRIINTALANSMARKNSPTQSVAVTEIRTLTDTVYLTKIKVERQVVKNTIRDTIYIEVPIYTELESIVADSGVEEQVPEELESVDTKSKPSSVQFNFSEADELNQ